MHATYSSFPHFLKYAVFVYVSSFSICVFYRLGVIEEEREEDERKLSVAIAAAERMNVLVRQKKCFLTKKIKIQALLKEKLISQFPFYIFTLIIINYFYFNFVEAKNTEHT